MPASLPDLLNLLGALPPHLILALRAVPRHHFLAEVFADEAYKNSALPIGHGLTASRPSTVIAMLLALGERRKVLEVGTGCGWQTALLSTFAHTYSIEAHPKLAERAARDLRPYPVTLRQGDGLQGWPEAAPFDGIVVCAALDEPPQALFEQLTEDGVMVAQVGAEICTINKRGAFTPIGKRGRFSPASA